ncbi:hypothetical protein [uncultured Tenacibaculum sp.]|uniref:hypothetical protein n=1 Tax=uncultured Tenacibaculum sp. TaxID=174713 RepID=UPI002620E275|nr:hypothetical protein [uncultured Tenacibaculum sp.]
MRKLFFRNLVSPLTEIELIESGFSIKKPFNTKPKLFNWEEIKSIRFTENYNTITIQKLDEKIVVKNDNIGWYELIQNIPSKFKEFDFKYTVELINSLKPCGICGIIAVRENNCIVCETITWNKKMTKNEIEYIKSKQLDFFSDRIKNGIEIKKIAEPEHGFKANKNWRLYI